MCPSRGYVLGGMCPLVKCQKVGVGVVVSPDSWLYILRCTYDNNVRK